jgi:hypothetical protein
VSLSLGRSSERVQRICSFRRCVRKEKRSEEREKGSNLNIWHSMSRTDTELTNLIAAAELLVDEVSRYPLFVLGDRAAGGVEMFFFPRQEFFETVFVDRFHKSFVRSDDAFNRIQATLSISCTVLRSGGVMTCGESGVSPLLFC